MAEGKVLSITQPVWLSFAAGQELAQAEYLTPAGAPLGIYRVEPEALARDGIDAAFQGEVYAPALDTSPIALPFHTPQSGTRRSSALGWITCAAGCPWVWRPWT